MDFCFGPLDELSRSDAVFCSAYEIALTIFVKTGQYVYAVIFGAIALSLPFFTLYVVGRFIELVGRRASRPQDPPDIS